MRALILAAGYGTRLGSMTQLTPKPMLPLCGRPLLEYVVRNVRQHGFRRLTINLHFLPETIRGYFGDGSRFDASIDYSYEPELLGTAGGVRKMAEMSPVCETMLVHYGDVLTDQDLSAMVRLHRERRALATMLVHQRKGSNSVAVLDEGGRVTRFLERPSEQQREGIDSPWANSGICLCERDVLDLIPADRPADLARDVFGQLVHSGRFFALPLSGYRCAIDSVERLAEAEAAVGARRCRLSWDDEPASAGRAA